MRKISLLRIVAMEQLPMPTMMNRALNLDNQPLLITSTSGIHLLSIQLIVDYFLILLSFRKVRRSLRSLFQTYQGLISGQTISKYFLTLIYTSILQPQSQILRYSLRNLFLRAATCVTMMWRIFHSRHLRIYSARAGTLRDSAASKRSP